MDTTQFPNHTRCGIVHLDVSQTFAYKIRMHNSRTGHASSSADARYLGYCRYSADGRNSGFLVCRSDAPLPTTCATSCGAAVQITFNPRVAEAEKSGVRTSRAPLRKTSATVGCCASASADCEVREVDVRWRRRAPSFLPLYLSFKSFFSNFR